MRKDAKFKCLKCGRECDVIEIDESDYEEMWGAMVKHEMYRDVSRCCGSEDIEEIEEGKDDD